MAKLCGLPVPGNVPGSPTYVAYVNPALVRILRAGSAETTTIYFDKEHSLTVAQSLDQVRAALDKALGD